MQQVKLLLSPYNSFRFKYIFVFVFVGITLYLYFNTPIIVYDINNSHQNLVKKSLERQDSFSGLIVRDSKFFINGKDFTILSGSIHYFRIHPDYWVDRLYRLKASGLNTVTTYVPWNLHQPCPQCKFLYKGFLNIRKFLKAAYNLGIFVIIRPGPYICAEWDLGGLPSWLLSLKSEEFSSKGKEYRPAFLRTSQNRAYLAAVDTYFKALLDEIGDLQYQEGKGGSVIAWQVENEYASYYSDQMVADAQAYMDFVKSTMLKYGANELFFTSDGTATYKNGRVKAINKKLGVLGGINFQNDPLDALKVLREFQPHKPLFVVEFWAGWFDHWSTDHLRAMQDVSSTKHQTGIDVQQFTQNLEIIVQQGASFNLYMYHGGTSFGFNSGANAEMRRKDAITKPKKQPKYFYAPDTTSYDYNAPVAENGDLTEKFYALRNLIKNYTEMFGSTSVLAKLPAIPPNIPAVAYGPIRMNSYMPLDALLTYVMNPIKSDKTMYIEDVMAQIYGNKLTSPKDLQNVIISGSGYILYRTYIQDGSFIDPSMNLNIHSLINDRAGVYWKAQLIAILDSDLEGKPQNLTILDHPVISNSIDTLRERSKFQANEIIHDVKPKLDLLVENLGRINFNYYDSYADIPHYLTLDGQKKGLSGPVYLNGKEIMDWQIYPLDFNQDFIKRLNRKDFIYFASSFQTSLFEATVPALFRGQLVIEGQPTDTYIDFQGWQKGCIFVNNFNLGRYWNVGPQFTLYVPGPLLKKGSNEILIWETEHVGTILHFVDKPIFKT